MFCIVDKESNCSDKKESPYDGNYVSVEGCENIDKSEYKSVCAFKKLN